MSQKGVEKYIYKEFSRDVRVNQPPSLPLTTPSSFLYRGEAKDVFHLRMRLLQNSRKQM